MDNLNSEYFEKWILDRIAKTNNQERYLFTDFDNDLLQIIYDHYSRIGTLDFLQNKYFLWCFKEPSDHINYLNRNQISFIGYSDLVTARNQPSADKVDFIVLIPKESQALPSNSSDSTSEEIKNSQKSFAQYIREEVFKKEFNYEHQELLTKLEGLIIEKHYRDSHYFFLQEIDKNKILKFYGILGEEKHFDKSDVFKSEYFLLFIDKIVKTLYEDSYTGLKEKLQAHNVNHYELVIKKFWDEKFESAKLLADNLTLVFFRNVEFYSKYINVDEWIEALKEEIVDPSELNYFIEYDGKKDEDHFDIFDSKTNKKCSDLYIPSDEKYILLEETLRTNLTNSKKSDWRINNVLKTTNSLNCEVDIKNKLLQIQSETEIFQTKKEKKNINLICYTLHTLPEENSMDLALSIFSTNENNQNLTIDLSDQRDIPTIEELQQFEIDLINSIEPRFDTNKTELLKEICLINESEENKVEEIRFLKLKNKKNTIKRNDKISIKIRTIDKDLNLLLSAYQFDDKDIKFNYKDYNDFENHVQNRNFKDYKIVIPEISDGLLLLKFINERTKEIRSIMLIIETEGDVKDELVSNSFQKLKAQNDSSLKNTIIKIRKKNINDVHAYYFTKKFGIEDTFLPTIFNFCDEMRLIEENDKCPSIGEKDLPSGNFRPFLSEFKDQFQNPEIKKYIELRKKINNKLIEAMGNKVSIDEIDFASLDLFDLVQDQLINYEKIISQFPNLAIWLDLFFIVLKNNNYNRMDDEPIALFFSPFHPVFLYQILSKSRILHRTTFGIGGKPNSIGSSISVNNLQNWVLDFKTSPHHFIGIETDSLQFTGFIHFNHAFKTNELSSILKSLEVNYNQSVGHLSYTQIKSALNKSYNYLSNKPEFNILIKSKLYDNSTNKAVLDWIKEANEEIKKRYSNQKLFINIFDARDKSLNTFPDNNLISYYKNELGLDFNWYMSSDQSKFDFFDITIDTSSVPDKAYCLQTKEELISYNFSYKNLFNFNLHTIDSFNVYEDIFPQKKLASTSFDSLINDLNDLFKNQIKEHKNQIENRLSHKIEFKTKVLALSNVVSNTNILQKTQDKSLWEFSISDYSFKDDARGDYFLFAEQQQEYLDKFKLFLNEIDPKTEPIAEEFIKYSKQIGLFQLKNLLSNQNFLKEYIACVTARKLLDCVIFDKNNTIVVPYDLFEPRLSKINKELDPKYREKGTQFPDFVLIEFNQNEETGLKSIDFRLIEIKYRSNVLPINDIDEILNDQTTRIKEIFNELNLYRNQYQEENLWNHTLSILMSEMFNYYHDNTLSIENRSAIVFNNIINSSYDFRINDSLLICIDDVSQEESGKLSNGIYFKIPKNLVHGVFDCNNNINNSFKKFFNSMTRTNTEGLKRKSVAEANKQTKDLGTLTTDSLDENVLQQIINIQSGSDLQLQTNKSQIDPKELKFDILIGNSSLKSLQMGILGETIQGKKIAIDLNETNTISLFGVQGAGKSYTIGTITEMVLKQFDDINLLPSPLASVIFHYSDSMDYKPEFTSMIYANDNDLELKKLNDRYGSIAGKIEDVVLLTPKDKVEDRKLEYPSIQVHPIEFGSNELNVQDWMFILGAVGNESTYIKQLKAIMKENRNNLTIDELSKSIEKSTLLSRSQKALANQKLSFAKEYINDEISLKEILKPGRLIIVDLRDEFIVKESALGLFVIMLNIFSSVNNYKGIHFNKFIVFDEAHKYMDNKELTGNIVTAIREMRHKGVSIMIASQDPPSLPNEIIELSKIVLLHKFNSPEWVKHIQKSIAQFSSLKIADMIALKTGEAYLWSEKASLNSISNNPVKISTRPRVTKHGGATIQAKKQ